jgi:hypothetical protein
MTPNKYNVDLETITSVDEMFLAHKIKGIKCNRSIQPNEWSCDEWNRLGYESKNECLIKQEVDLTFYWTGHDENGDYFSTWVCFDFDKKTWFGNTIDKHTMEWMRLDEDSIEHYVNYHCNTGSVFDMDISKLIFLKLQELGWLKI